MRNTISSVWLATATLCAGCSSYQNVPFEKIQERPSDYVDRNARVHFTPTAVDTVTPGRSQRTAGRAMPDSMVSLRIAAIDYPVITGRTLEEARLYGKPDTPVMLDVDLQTSTRMEVRKFSVTRTALLAGGLSLVGLLIYAIATDDSGVDIPLNIGASAQPAKAAPAPN